MIKSPHVSVCRQANGTGSFRSFNPRPVFVPAVDAPFALNDSYVTTAGVPLVVDIASSGVLYQESFDVPDAPSPLSAAGCSIVSGSENPTVQSTDFAVEDNLNMNKITAIDDLDFGFTSGHVFLEHDINNLILAGQGFGETLIYTDDIVAQNGGNPLDLAGASLFVDYANGNINNRGPSFQFAVRSGDSWFVTEDAHNAGTASSSVANASTGPLSTATSFVPIEVNPGAFGADSQTSLRSAARLESRILIAGLSMA